MARRACAGRCERSCARACSEYTSNPPSTTSANAEDSVTGGNEPKLARGDVIGGGSIETSDQKRLCRRARPLPRQKWSTPFSQYINGRSSVDTRQGCNRGNRFSSGLNKRRSYPWNLQPKLSSRDTKPPEVNQHMSCAMRPLLLLNPKACTLYFQGRSWQTKT